MANNTGNRYDIKCHACGETTIVVTEPDVDPAPSFCPICGEQQEQEEAEDEGSGN